MHLKTHTSEDASDSVVKRIIEKDNFGKKCPICDFVGKSKNDYYTHFKEKHDINLEIEELKFSSSNVFKVWLANTQKETKTKFIIEYISKSSTSYKCHRSGVFKSKSTGQRHLKTQGTKKICGFCPAALKCFFDKDDGVNVTFIKTHVGHLNELCHLILSNTEREFLATKIASKIPFDVILDDIRDEITASSPERLHLLTKKDLFNIETCFNLHSISQRHRNDAVSVDAWVEEMKNSCVLFYKPQGTSLDDYPQFKQKDFLLIIMTEGQKIALKNYCKECICIDGTNDLNSYDFELHTLLVLDELRQGFPSAFCISNRSDETAMKFFFSCIKKEVGTISTKTFMSDMAESYYNAWVQIMPEVQYRLFCTWHVDRAWRKNLHYINLKDKQVSL